MKKLLNRRKEAISLLKFDLKMKLSLLLIMVAFMGLYAHNGHAQKNSVTLDVENQTIREVLDIIETSTDFKFIYKTRHVDLERRISLKVSKVSIENLLQTLFKNTDTAYRVKGAHIILREKAVKQLPTKPIVVPFIKAQMGVTGKVTDATGAPLPGVAVVVKGTKNGVATDFDGNYNITVPGPKSILVFTSMGFVKKEVPVGNQQVINVTLKEDVSELDEVVVNAGYYKTSQKLATGNISRITAADIEKQPVLDPFQAMQGRMAGVEIQQTSGIPGSAINIRIRGLNSLNNGQALIDGQNRIDLPNANQPFYIIDGVPIPSQSLNSNVLRLPNGSPLSFLNPNIIESIEVLKDADATAIYGSRGANGVVLITTKKGKMGKPRITMDYSHGLVSLPARLNLLNTSQYLEIRNEAFRNAGQTPDERNAPDLVLWDPNRDVDWQEELISRTGEQINTNFSFSGGTETTQYSFTGNYSRQTTIFNYDDSVFNNASGTMNLNHNSANNKFSAKISVVYTLTDNKQNGSFASSSILRLPPNAPELFDENGNLNWENGFQNPLAFTEQEYVNTSRMFNSNAILDYQILPQLRIRSTFGFTNNQTDESRLQPLSSINPNSGLSGSNQQANASSETWIMEPQIEFNETFGDVEISVFAGTTFQSTTSRNTRINGQGYDSDVLIRDISVAPDVTIFNTSDEYRYTAVFGRVNLNWKNKYILNLTGRRDGSSRFGPGRQWGNFGAVGATWLFSEENLIKNNLGFLSLGKLRASYGVTGNDQIGNYQFLETYNNTFNANYDGNPGVVLTRAANPDFSWETNKKLEVALEVGLFKDRIFLSGSWYRNLASNQLTQLPLTRVTGFPTVQINQPAIIENTGLEIVLSTKNIRSKDFQWTTDFNITRVRNKLLEFPNIEDFPIFDNEWVVGRSLFGIKQIASLGLNPETGLYDLVDADNDGRIGVSDRVDFVEVFSDYFGGINNSFRWKGLQFDFFLQFVKQNAAGTSTGISSSPGSNLGNQPVEVLNRWQNPGDQATFQQYIRNTSINRLLNFHQISRAALVDASFIRLQNVSLTYQFPEKINKILNLERSSIFLQAQNLLTLTPFRGLDPETQGFSLPPLRIITTGIRLTF